MGRQESSLKALTVLLKASSSVEKLVKTDMTSYGLNATEFAVMELLYNKGKQQIQMIGKKILLASSSITYVINQLDDKGLVNRIADKKDKRVTYIELSEEGYKKMDTIFPKHSEAIEDLFKKLTVEEMNQLTEALKKVGYTAAEKIHR